MSEGIITDEIDAEEIANNVADILDGAILVLGDVNDRHSPNMRIHACIAALERAREQLEPLLDAF